MPNLNVYFVSTPENLANLDQIRNNNLSAIGLSNQKNQKIGDKLIVWISFSVHGNEYAGMESAMTVAYELLNPANKESKEWKDSKMKMMLKENKNTLIEKLDSEMMFKQNLKKDP